MKRFLASILVIALFISCAPVSALQIHATEIEEPISQEESIVAQSIAVTTLPTKVEYIQGADTALDVTGGVITVTYSDETTETIDMTAEMVSGFSMDTVGELTLTVTYAALTTNFSVTVSAAPATEELAEEEKLRASTIIANGTCGSNVTWSLDTDGVLTISGTGAIGHFAYESIGPWYDNVIKSIVIEEGVTSIGQEAFYNCSSLESVSIPATVTVMSDLAFCDCNALEIVYITDLAAWCEIDFGFLANPAANGSSVYLNGNLITNLQIPDGITSINDSVFEGCRSVTTVVFPEGVTNISYAAFRNCDGLTSIEIPDGATTIGQDAFSGCDNLTSVIIPDSITSIGQFVFDRCNNILGLFYTGTQAEYNRIDIGTYNGIDETRLHYEVSKVVVNGQEYLYCPECDSHFYLDGSKAPPLNVSWSIDDEGTLTISGTGSMGAYNESDYLAPWYNDRENIKKVVIESGITDIGSDAFYNCINMTTISIPDSVTSVGRAAFGCCRSLSSITLPDTITSIGGSAFWDCDALTSVEIPDGVTTISDAMFINCNSLENVELPDSITKIEHNAFHYCSSLNNIILPDKLAVIEQNTFTDCSSLTEIKLPNSVTTIDGAAFASCTSLKGIFLPTGLTKIDWMAFWECENLSTVFFTGTESQWKAIDINNEANANDSVINAAKHYEVTGTTYPGVNCVYCPECDAYFKLDGTEIELLDNDAQGTCGDNLTWAITSDGTLTISGTGAMNAYDDMNNKAPWYNIREDIKRVVIEPGATNVGACAFSRCSNLESVSIPDSVTSIGSDAFLECIGLMGITIPDNVASIGGQAFRGCTGLTSITLPDGVTSISDGLFLECTSLMEVALPDDVASIGDSAFAECAELTEITLPNSVTSIGMFAFGRCTNLASITIPDSVTSIGGGVFQECVALESIVIPDSVEEMGMNVLGYCSNLKSVMLPKNLSYIPAMTLQGCTSLTSITLPESITEIEQFAFSETGLTTIAIPDGVTSIGMFAFGASSSLKGILLPAGLTEISNDAFYLSDNISVMFFAGTESQWETIFTVDESNATGGLVSAAKHYEVTAENFAGVDCVYCPECEVYFLLNGTEITLQGIEISTLPTKLTYEAGEALDVTGGKLTLSYGDDITSTCDITADMVTGFDNTKAGEQTLTVTYGGKTATFKITVADDAVARGTCGDGLTWTLDAEGTLTISGTGTMNAYQNQSGQRPPWYSKRESIKQVIVTDGVTSVGTYAFIGCTALTSITIADSVTSIGTRVIQNCTSLESITAPFVSETLDSMFGYVMRPSLKHITAVGDSVITDAFKGCTSLTSVTVADGVTSIGENAFKGCTSLTEVKISSSVTSIALGAFSGCGSLKSMTLPFVGGGRKTAYDTYQYPLGYIFGANSYTGGVSIKQWYYGSSTSSTTSSTYTIPASLKSVTITGGEILCGAFYNCSGLTSIAIGNGVTSIGSDAFYNCSGLTSITLSENVTSIGSSAFRNCSSLTSITIPDNVTDIEQYAFSGCTGLTSITIPDSVTSIGSSMFYGCSGLTSITIPDGVTNIGSSMFYGCSGLTSITIPDGVTNIGDWAFDGCSSLASITIPASATSVGAYAFNGCNNLTDIYYVGDVDAWQMFVALNSFNSSPMKANSLEKTLYLNGTLATSAAIPDSVTIIGSYAFDGWYMPASITIPGSVTSIGDYAFRNCRGLKSITILDGVTIIGNYAFNNCYGLTSVTIGNGVEHIGSYAFSRCNSLTSITIPDSVTDICESAFHSCSGLTSITIPDSVTSIGDYAFASCRGLTSITITDGVRTIGWSAFEGCTGLTSVTISDGVESIGSDAFSDCSALSDVFYMGTESQRAEMSIDNSNSNNKQLLNAKWHYEVEIVTIKGQEYIYCPECNCYYNLDGTKAAAPTVETSGNINYTAIGQTVTVEYSTPCKVGYLSDGKYVAVSATQNPDGSYSFELPEGVTDVVLVAAGDSNGDGKMTSADYGRLNAALLGKVELTPEALFAADVNGDGKVTSADYGRLNAVLLGKTTLTW